MFESKNNPFAALQNSTSLLSVIHKKFPSRHFFIFFIIINSSLLHSTQWTVHCLLSVVPAHTVSLKEAFGQKDKPHHKTQLEVHVMIANFSLLYAWFGLAGTGETRDINPLLMSEAILVFFFFFGLVSVQSAGWSLVRAWLEEQDLSLSRKRMLVSVPDANQGDPSFPKARNWAGCCWSTFSTSQTQLMSSSASSPLQRGGFSKEWSYHKGGLLSMGRLPKSEFFCE